MRLVPPLSGAAPIRSLAFAHDRCPARVGGAWPCETARAAECQSRFPPVKCTRRTSIVRLERSIDLGRNLGPAGAGNLRSAFRMRDSWKAARVGLFVVLAIAASFGVYKLVEERAAGEDGYNVYAIFDDAQGLVPKSRVLIAGIQVGYIDTIRLVNAQARVDIHIDEGVILYDDATVQKKSASILGEAILVINPGTMTRTPVVDGARIAVAEPPPAIDDILAIVGDIGRDVRQVSGQLARVFGTDEGGQQMASSLRNLTEALEAANRLISQNEEVIGRTLRNVEAATGTAGPQLVRILDNVEHVTADVRTIMDNNRDGLNTATGQVSDTIASINRASHQLEEVLADVEQITGRTAAGEGTVGRLTSDETLIDEVEGVAEGIGDIVGGIARLQTIVGLRSEYNFLANTFKSYVELRLQPREDRYYLIQLINDPRGLTEFSQTVVRRSPPIPGEPPFYQETRVETRDAFRFTLMFAKRVAFATARFGILESTGGVGFDFHLFDDALEMNADLFAFGENTYPRLRVRAAYEVLSRFWVLGGVDDALNESSDFFIGGMLRFNDEDLKSILPFAGGSLSAGGN